MPPWAAFVPRSMNLLKRSAIERLRTPAAASSCCRNVARPRFSHFRVRSASTHVAPSAINLRPNIPPQNKELHNALSALSGAAETWVNISRLQLALSELVVQDGVTRVALLGLNSQVSAQRLARLLLADPLGAEEKWEQELEHAGDGNERAVLLKYGEDSDAHTPTPLYKVLSVPSRVLRLHNLEILVSTLNVNVASNATAASTESSAESILVPKLQATSARGTPVPYPVHKTLIFGEGLDSAIAFGRFSADSVKELDDMVKLAVNLPAPSEDTVPEVQTTSAAVNLETGTKAIATFRDSIQNSLVYEHGWFRSGLPVLSNWLIQDLQPSSAIKPTMKTLISSLIADVEAKLTKEDVALQQRRASTPAHTVITASILSNLDSWAEQSHTELRDQLDDAFSSRNWQKLAWWKLLWRVDDVTMFTTEILERRWLVSAEKNSIYLAGRMEQAGFPDDIRHLTIADAAIPEVTAQDTAPTAENQGKSVDISTDVKSPQPWPEHIATARAELINDAVPPLQALAQRLLLQTFSTTAISSALTAILYVGVESFSLFEAGAVAALGLTFSLRRMQKLWEGARESWQGTVREEGRRTLKRTEDVVRVIIRASELGGRGGVRDDGEAERARAREAVRRVREVLER
ncbi:hypothetical protein T440DRAFT_447320 [Plenodomus tracheiphilus IPT5]|uniref:Mmc1 C-terminal domain-containing protein n=1 Tax=Plenodomus tracheiphilus IPT5 TaxID=1408161 RepID=A0A6A7BC29_9PLEO|nr:hypothetical protein T440DRAFT_447320 [Plenodomus tracheiphilus IPT5]